MALIDSETLKRKIMLLPYFLGCKYNRRKMNGGDFYAGFLNGLYATTTLIGLEPEAAGSWIPIKMREATREEKEKFNCEFAYDCPIPEDSDIVLITDSDGNVTTDIFYNDVDGACFESQCDYDDVVAWMPLPDPYQKGDADE